MFEHFQPIDVDIEDAGIFVRRAGAGPAVLLLHGFPQTHLMWRDIAPLLADRFTVICADLRGYGRSVCPASSADHAPYAKRAMASEMVAMMARLGFTSFMVAGHDRGGRVAYRMALDHPGRIEKLAVLDIVPTADAWDRADARLALGFWPWSLLAQPEPLPENILALSPSSIVTVFANPNHMRPSESVNSALAVPSGPPRLSRLVQPDSSNRKVPDPMDIHNLPDRS